MNWQISDPAGRAVEAAQAAIWEWNAKARRLVLQVTGDSPAGALAGDWAFDDFLNELQDVSRMQFADRFRRLEDAILVDETVTLVDGRSARFVGGFEAEGLARGLFLMVADGPAFEPDTQVEPVFQPIVDLRTGQVAGFEALARWRGLDGQIRAADTLPAGALNLTSERLGITMVRRAAEALSVWSVTDGYQDLFVQVNLSAADLFRPGLQQEVHDAIVLDGLKPGQLRIELTEQAALRDFDGAVQAVAAFRDSGAGIILDDFGSGHSSFAWLAKIEADGLKIDPQLIGLSGTKRVDTILAAIARLGQSLGMTVTAEGVERLDLLEPLRAIGCSYGQGYAFARPMVAEAVDDYLLRQRARQTSGAT